MLKAWVLLQVGFKKQHLGKEEDGSKLGRGKSPVMM
jgi:hypothetical protein